MVHSKHVAVGFDKRNCAVRPASTDFAHHVCQADALASTVHMPLRSGTAWSQAERCVNTIQHVQYQCAKSRLTIQLTSKPPTSTCGCDGCNNIDTLHLYDAQSCHRAHAATRALHLHAELREHRVKKGCYAHTYRQPQTLHTTDTC